MDTPWFRVEALSQTIRPNKHTQRVKWNTSWEDDLAYVYDVKTIGRTGPPSSEGARFHALQNLLKPSQSQSLLLTIEDKTKGAIQQQETLALNALYRFANDDLEQRWKTMTDDHRKKIILEGIYKTSCRGGELDTGRRWCPEITVQTISADQGQLFIDWLQSIISDRRVGLQLQPVHFPNILVDRVMESITQMRMELIRREALLCRSLYISSVIRYILLAIYNEQEESNHILQKQPKQYGSSKSIYQTVKQVAGKEAALNWKNYLKEAKGEPQAVTVCWQCGKDPQHSASKAPLRACKACRAIGRVIPYCSVECQKEDWKKGVPRPHKQVCGKPFTMDEPLKPKPSSVSKVPPMKIPDPAPSFKRSHALEYQINLLLCDWDVDYVIVHMGDEKDDIGVITGCGEVFMRLHFLIARRRAFTNGDIDCLSIMFVILAESAKEIGVSADRIANQLEREFGVEVDWDMKNTIQPTREEKEWAAELIVSLAE